MTVYFEPRSPQWYDYIAPVATELLGGVIKNQFDKSAEARKFQMEQDAAAAAEMRRREGAEWNRNFLGQAPDLLTNQTGMMDYATHASMLQPELAPNMDDIIKSIWRDKNLSDVNLGDRNLQTVFDPMTGAIQQAAQEYGLNPTDKYKADALLQQERMSRSASNQVNLQPFIDKDGRLYYVDPRTGDKVDTGLLGPSPSPKYDSDRGKAYQSIMSEIQERYTNRVGAPVPLDQWSEEDRVSYVRARDALENGLYGGVNMPPGGQRPEGGGTPTPPGASPVTPLPPGMSEDAILDAMRKTGLSREEVISRMNARARNVIQR